MAINKKQSDKSRPLLEITPSVGIAVFRNGEILLVKHGVAASNKVGVYGLPAGRIPSNETEKETAVRELYEETGLRTSEADLVDFPHNIFFAEIERKSDLIEKFSYKVFLCTAFSGNLKGSQETKPEWVKITDLKKFNLLPNVHEAILTAKRVLHGRKKRIYVGSSLTQAPEAFKKSIELFKEKLRVDYEILDFIGLVKGTPKEVFEWDTNCVKTCDLFVADCTHPAIGLGYELGIALSLNKPILAVAHKDARVTRLVLGVTHPKYTFARYDSIFDVVTLIKNKIEFL